MTDAINRIRHEVKDKNPLIHCITNPISKNKCANVILGAGARPIMAEHPKEVCEISATAGAVMLNTGNITDVRKKSIMKTAVFCNKNNIPFLYDAVGVACSKLRRKYTYRLFNKAIPSVVKGNYSEILALYDKNYHFSGVDSQKLDTETVTQAVISLSHRYGTVILASGKTDIISDGVRLYYMNNGTAMLGKITGTGCVTGALCSCFLSAENSVLAPVTALAVIGISAEFCKSQGQAGFEAELFDNISTFEDSSIEKYIKIKEINL